MGQCNVKRWIAVILPLVEDSTDPLGVLDLTTNTQPFSAPEAHKMFQKGPDGCVKVVHTP